MVHIERAIRGMYNEYASLYAVSNSIVKVSSSLISSEIMTNDSSCNKRIDIRKEFRKQKKVNIPIDSRSEFEVYLADELIESDEGNDDTFDILAWWKVHSAKYQILSKLVRDILAVPVYIVASESSFSTSGRVLNQYHSSLRSSMVEALICAQDWLRFESKTPISLESGNNSDNLFSG